MINHIDDHYHAHLYGHKVHILDIVFTSKAEILAIFHINYKMYLANVLNYVLIEYPLLKLAYKLLIKC